MTNHPLDEEAVFQIARKIADTEARNGYLDQVCAGDQALRERIEALLTVHEQDQGFLKSAENEIAATVAQSPLLEKPGVSIGRYKLMEQIGEGGMGTVFVAQQERPIRRKVAVKVIKPGMDSKAVVARFEAERQALAMMNHPNIAQVLDAGATEFGRPYFAMEYVKGVPITEYCDRNRLTIAERLGLFIQVCQAIQHAHQKGIIHRDIKPSNVLVTLHDGKPVPKVIDFGVAKAINARLTDKTIYTEHLQVVGTLLYMSPEQAELSGLDVDTRSDIYSLGVLLYELLTGTTPFQKDELNKAGFDEQRRIIRDKEPPRASVRISSLGETAVTVAEHRKTDAKKLRDTVRGDLDWVILKSMEKDRTRRYESVASFSKDVQSYLGNDPVEAHPPSIGYRIRKYAVRNRATIAVTGLIVTVLSLSLFFTMQNERKLAETIEKYGNAIVERALVTAVSGNLDETQRLIRDAKRADIPESSLQFLEALADLFGGNVEQAVASLEELVRQSPNDAKAWALLFNAYRHQGNLDGYAQAEKQLEVIAADNERLSDLELMFIGYAESDTHVSQRKGVAKLQKLVQERPSWGLAHAMLAHALANVGNDVRNSEFIDRAKGELMIAGAVLPETPFVTAVGLHVLSVELVHARENGLATRQLETTAEVYASVLEREYGDYLYGRIMRARYFSAIDRPEESLKELVLATKKGGGSGVRSSRICLLNRLSMRGEAKQQGDCWAYVLDADVSGAREMLKNDIAPPSLLHRIWGNYVRTLLGDELDAIQDWLDIQQEEMPRWCENPLKLFTGSCQPEELLAEASGSRFWEAHAHFCVGAHCLANSDREEAKRHFKKCIEANSWQSDFHHLAIAIYSKLCADEDWPHNLKR